MYCFTNLNKRRLIQAIQIYFQKPCRVDHFLSLSISYGLAAFAIHECTVENIDCRLLVTIFHGKVDACVR